MITYNWECRNVEAYPTVNEVPKPLKHKEGDELPIHLRDKEWDELPFFLKYKEGDEEKLSKIIYRVHFSLIGVSEELDLEGVPVVERIESVCNLKSVDVSTFKPIDNLNNEEVTAWVKSTLGEERVNELEKIVEDKIDRVVNPKSVILTIK